jgi:hypothetical protein
MGAEPALAVAEDPITDRESCDRSARRFDHTSVAGLDRRGTPAATSQLCTVWAATPHRFAIAAIVRPASTYSPRSVAASGLAADPSTTSESAIPRHPANPTLPWPASAGARVRDTSPASPTTRRRGTPPKRVDRCNPRAQIAGSGRGQGGLANVVMARWTARGASAYPAICRDSTAEIDAPESVFGTGEKPAHEAPSVWVGVRTVASKDAPAQGVHAPQIQRRGRGHHLQACPCFVGDRAALWPTFASWCPPGATSACSSSEERTGCTSPRYGGRRIPCGPFIRGRNGPVGLRLGRLADRANDRAHEAGRRCDGRAGRLGCRLG